MPVLSLSLGSRGRNLLRLASERALCTNRGQCHPSDLGLIFLRPSLVVSLSISDPQAWRQTTRFNTRINVTLLGSFRLSRSSRSFSRSHSLHILLARCRISMRLDRHTAVTRGLPLSMRSQACRLRFTSKVGLSFILRGRLKPARSVRTVFRDLALSMFTQSVAGSRSVSATLLCSSVSRISQTY